MCLPTIQSQRGCFLFRKSLCVTNERIKSRTTSSSPDKNQKWILYEFFFASHPDTVRKHDTNNLATTSAVILERTRKAGGL